MNPSDVHPLLACPRCGGDFESSFETTLKCLSCGEFFPIREGVPSFYDPSVYWGEEFNLDEMRSINSLAAEKGWREAVRERVKPKSPERAEYIEGFFRADWRFLFPVEEDWTVLDVGAGWGTLSCALAEVVGEVVALESAFERAKFIQHRIEQDAISNLTAIHGTLTRPPLKAGSFDLIALNGVLEWLGWADTSRSVPSVQVAHLKTCWNLLKPGGWLYVGIENRFGISSWLGAMDHSYLKYTSLMPRMLAHGYTNLKRKHAYRTYTYSPIGYRRLLTKARFEEIDFFATLPTYSRPVYYWPVGNGKALKRVIKILTQEKPNNAKLGWAAKIVDRTPEGLLSVAAPYLVPHLLIVARKAKDDRID
ncbi:MAG: methyltransferase domain-containing protein [Candidatus Omnitrophica bacterium]|nr:methyltransferase domain-containing protein [Candidatus Omnitrophota bacterium]